MEVKQTMNKQKVAIYTRKSSEDDKSVDFFMNQIMQIVNQYNSRLHGERIKRGIRQKKLKQL